jgi:hypothetical protein
MWWCGRDHVDASTRLLLAVLAIQPQVSFGQVQAEEHNLASGGLLSMISPVSDTFK